MRKIFLALSVISLVIIGSSMAFASTEDEARDALITYSGTDAFADLFPEERRACMAWVAEGGYMNELCRSAITKLISDAPNAVTPSQRKALLAVSSGKIVSSPASTTPTSSGQTTITKDDNTAAVIAAGVVGIIAGMVIHNNWPRHKSDTVYYPAPSPHYRPAPPTPHHAPRPVSRPPQPGRGIPPASPRRPGPR